MGEEALIRCARFALALLTCFAGGSATAGCKSDSSADEGDASKRDGDASTEGPQGSTFGGGSADAATSGLPEEVWGHSEDVLYRLDPRTRAVTIAGTLAGCVLTDIALDADGNMWGTSDTALFKIDTQKVTCTKVADGAYPNSLSFVPRGTVDANVEALVGFEGATYVRIDLVTGGKTTIGGLDAPYSSSGDIVSVKGGLTYLTVDGGPGGQCESKDCIVEIDPKTGRFIRNFGTLPLADVYGLSFWGGTLYGFTNGGTLLAITVSNTGVKTDIVPIPNAPPLLRFWGAGSSTSAPLIAK